jgi:hypothetical protein
LGIFEERARKQCYEQRIAITAPSETSEHGRERDWMELGLLEWHCLWEWWRPAAAAARVVLLKPVGRPVASAMVAVVLRVCTHTHTHTHTERERVRRHPHLGRNCVQRQAVKNHLPL